MKILLISLLACFQIIAYANDSKIVATVNGVNISLAELEKTYQQTLLFVSNRKVTRESVLNDLINRELGVQRAKSEKIDQDPIVRAKLDDILYHAQISKELENKFTEIKVTDKDVENYYKTNKEYRTAHILYRLKANPSPEDVKKALEQSMEVYNQVSKNPEEFADLATKLSQTNVAQIGGDLGYQPPTRYAPEYFEAIKGKNVGFISQPIRTQYGFHVIKVLGIKDFDKIDKNLYKKIIYDIKRDALIEQYHQNLRKKAKVTVNNEFLK
jgi:parvulin-like peptidyl-prolyl isomerase